MDTGAGSHGKTVDFNSPLTPQQQIFVAEYTTHFNGHRAAIAAKYSETSAHSQASQLLENPKIQNAINQALTNFGASQAVLKKRIISQLINLSFSDIRDYLEYKGNGLTLKDSATLTREQAAAIVEVKERKSKYGTTVAFKLAQKERSLELLARHLGMLADGLPTHTPTAVSANKIMSFEDFCLNAGYPKVFPKQIEMRDFVFSPGIRLLLGTRGIGKSDFCTIMGTAYEIYREFAEAKEITYSQIIGTKVATRGHSMIKEIARACELAGVTFETKNAKVLRVTGLKGKDHSVEALSIGSSLRGRHPKRAVLDDIITPEDTSEAVRNKAQKFYSEVCKLTQNVAVIGQPVHKFDLLEELRPIVQNKMEVPHGTIPELDADLEALRIAGVDEASIQASYHLKIINEGATPFDNIKYADHFPDGESVAFIDPANEGKDFTAVTIMRANMQGVAVVGFVWRKAWNHCLDDMAKKFARFKVKKIAFEINALGSQPLDVLRTAFKPLGLGVIGRLSNTNKHSRIMAAGMFAHMIHLCKESDQKYVSHVVKYEYGAEFDDAPDSLASCLNWLGYIRGKV